MSEKSVKFDGKGAVCIRAFVWMTYRLFTVVGECITLGVHFIFSASKYICPETKSYVAASKYIYPEVVNNNTVDK